MKTVKTTINGMEVTVKVADDHPEGVDPVARAAPGLVDAPLSKKRAAPKDTPPPGE